MSQGVEKAAWLRESLERERSGGLTYAGLATTLVPVWSLFDWSLEPRLAPSFLVVRLFAAACGVLLFVAIRRARVLSRLRCYVMLEVLLTGGICAVMMASVESSFTIYAIGTSTVLWGTGLVLTWPSIYDVVLFALLSGAYALADRLAGNVRPPGEQIGMMFYLGTAAVVSAVSGHVSHGLHRRVFAASFRLERQNHDLDQAMRSLQAAQARLVESEKLSALGRLLIGLSHEINNPVNVIRNSLQPLRDYVDDLLRVLGAARAPQGGAEVDRLWRELDVDFIREDFRDALATMETAVGRIESVQGDLRAFVHGDAVDAVVGDPNDGLRATLGMLRGSIPEGVSVDVACGDLPRLPLRQGQMNQVWLNLVQNALDALGPRGAIRVQTSRVGDSVEIAIADDGPGVPAEARAHLFEPFFTTKCAGKGTGLGLATSYLIVKGHGGTIDLDASHAPGARFVVRLPLAPIAS